MNIESLFTGKVVIALFTLSNYESMLYTEARNHLQSWRVGKGLSSPRRKKSRRPALETLDPAPFSS